MQLRQVAKFVFLAFGVGFFIRQLILIDVHLAELEVDGEVPLRKLRPLEYFVLVDPFSEVAAHDIIVKFAI